MGWKVVAAAAAGSGHLEQGLPCQDAFHWLADAQRLVAVVCDGAGSASHSAVGAQHGSRFITQALFSRLTRHGAKTPVEEWQQHIAAAIATAREQLSEMHLSGTHQGDDRSLRDFHATVVGVIASPDINLFFQIGDGAGAAVWDLQWDTPVMALPENGEFSDETFFYTEDHWQAHLRFTVFSAREQLIALMSDGAMAFVAAPGRKGLDAKFMAPVTKYLDTVDAQTGAQALLATLNNPKTHAITADDKTLLWAKRGS